MQSLADFLGVSVAKSEDDKVSRDGITASNDERFEKLTGKEFAVAVLDSPEFRRYIVAGLILGDLPAAILCRLIDHGWGKPPDRLEHTGKDGNPIETVTEIRRTIVRMEDSYSDNDNEPTFYKTH